MGKLVKLDKKLSFWIGGFFFLTVFFNLFRLEVTPFFLWGMYSAIEKPETAYAVDRITVGDTENVDLYSGVTDNNRFFLFSPLQYYKELKENNNVDIGLTILNKKFPSSGFLKDNAAISRFDKTGQMSGFGAWYARYLSAQTGKTVKRLTVSTLSVSFTPENRVIVDSSHVFLRWP